MIQGKKRIVISMVGLMIFLLLAYGSEDTSGPKMELMSHYAKGDIYFVNGEADWGYKITIRARNNGEAGNVTAMVKLHTGEGMWSKEQADYFNEGDEKELFFVFTEPSISSGLTDIRYEIYFK